MKQPIKRRLVLWLAALLVLVTMIALGLRVHRARQFANLVTAVAEVRCRSVGNELTCPDRIRCLRDASSTEAITMYRCVLGGSEVQLFDSTRGSSRFIGVVDFRNFGPNVSWLSDPPNRARQWKYSLFVP